MTDHPKHDPEAHDGCLCDLPHDEREHTADHDLPPAVGGVEGDLKAKPRKRRATRTAVEGE